MLFNLFALSLAKSNIVIAKRGEPSPYSIIVAWCKYNDYPRKHLMYAAEQFQGLVYNITGVNLTIQYDDQPLPEKAILIGYTNFSKEYCPKQETFDPQDDSFHWIATDNYIFLNGGRRGIVYGVYELFQRYGNVRFYSSWMTVIPPADTFEIPEDYDFYSTPDFYFRESHDEDPSGGYEESAVISSHMRMDSGESRVNWLQGGMHKGGGGSHTIIGLVQKDGQCSFDQAHVDRYALKKEGKDENKLDERTKYQVCLTHPANLEAVLYTLKKNLPNDPSSYFTEVSQGDGDDFCHCKRCMRDYMHYGNHSSGLWINFLNKLYDRLAPLMPQLRPEKPEIFIRTLSYVNSLQPPENIKVNDHIIVRLCLYQNDNSLPVEQGTYHGSVEFMKALKGWTKLSRHVMIWLYIDNDNRPEIIRPTWFQLPEDIKTFHKYGVWGTMYGRSQTYQSTKFNGKDIRVGRIFTDFDRMKAYAHTILTWNASLETDDVINDFLRGYFGPKAAPYLRQYLDDGYREIKLYPDHNSMPLGIDLGHTYQVYPPLRTKEFFEHGWRLWQKALELARQDSDPRFEYNVLTGMVPHGMSIYLYYKEHPVIATWSSTEIKNHPDPLMDSVARRIPEACPSFIYPHPISLRVCNLNGDYGDEKGGLKFKNNYDWTARCYFKWLTDVVKPDLITCGNVKFGSKGGYYSGRGGLLELNGWNYLDYNTGGFDFNNMPVLYNLDQQQKENYTTVSVNGVTNSYAFDELFYKRWWPRTNLFYKITKDYTSQGNGVKGSFTFQYHHTKDCPTHTFPEDKTIHTVATVSCKLDDSATQVAWRTSDGKWTRSTLLKQLNADLVGFKNNAKSFDIASPISKRAMHFEISRNPESVSIELNRTSKVLTVYIAFNDPPSMNLIRAEITLTPIASINIPSSMEEKKNEYFANGRELSSEDFTNIDQPYETNNYRFYVGGDDKAYSGRAYISEHKSDKISAMGSNPFLRFEENSNIKGFPHYGDSFNFSAHIRCDVTDPTKDSFTFFNFYRPSFGAKAKNAGEYAWYTLTVKNITYSQSFFLHALSGASKCYVDKLRLIPIKASEIPYVPPRIQEFEFNNNLPPMPPVDLYQLIPDDSLSHETIVSIAVMSTTFSLAAIVIIGTIIYKKFFAEKKEEDRSEINTAFLV